MNLDSKVEGLATALLSVYRRRKRTMSTNKTKKVKMATKSCPECDQQVRNMFLTTILISPPIASAQHPPVYFISFYFLFISLTIKTEMDSAPAPVHTCKHAKSQSKDWASWQLLFFGETAPLVPSARTLTALPYGCFGRQRCGYHVPSAWNRRLCCWVEFPIFWLKFLGSGKSEASKRMSKFKNMSKTNVVFRFLAFLSGVFKRVIEPKAS